jgi:hypothetical protein
MANSQRSVHWSKSNGDNNATCTGQNDGDNSADYTGHNPDDNNAAYTGAHTRPNNSRPNVSDNARTPELNNGKQSTDLDKLDAVDVELCRDTEKSGGHNKP